MSVYLTIQFSQDEDQIVARLSKGIGEDVLFFPLVGVVGSEVLFILGLIVYAPHIL